MAPISLLLASSNTHKIHELRAILLQENLVDVDIKGLNDVSGYIQPVETGATFEENALIKARAGYQATGLPCLGDDSGLTVDALSGMPGIFSARWSGTHGDDHANMRLLLAQLSDVPDIRRTGAFVCVCALVWGDREHEQIVVRGSWAGTIGRTPQGDHGFGYDPIFIPEGFDCTVGQLDTAIKDSCSHRYRALQLLLPSIAQLSH